MKIEEVLVHKFNGTFAELVKTTNGYSLKFTVRSGNTGFTSISNSYSLDEIMEKWRIATNEEIDIFNKSIFNLK